MASIVDHVVFGVMTFSGIFILCSSILKFLRRLRGGAVLDRVADSTSLLFYSSLGILVAVCGLYGFRHMSDEQHVGASAFVVLAFGVIGVIAQIASEVRLARWIKAVKQEPGKE